MTGLKGESKESFKNIWLRADKEKIALFFKELLMESIKIKLLVFLKIKFLTQITVSAKNKKSNRKSHWFKSREW